MEKIKFTEQQKGNFTYQSLKAKMQKYALANKYELPDKDDVKDLFLELDTNCNGKLTKQEIQFFVEKFESIIDIIKDKKTSKMVSFSNQEMKKSQLSFKDFPFMNIQSAQSEWVGEKKV